MCSMSSDDGLFSSLKVLLVYRESPSQGRFTAVCEESRLEGSYNTSDGFTMLYFTGSGTCSKVLSEWFESVAVG